ncbi:hypothetical protein [Nannocystis punicea]|uniref:Uncharacterized protein n=1 Tax=Nannocystis punicea TaxID=2995304 RepID=A0ABY7H0B2_9BACT|nr:hypothetical protein [Nannocystis poenicansa]WAS92469.1 hypothetical protein O0S08_40335 [Nannocystis poenicansa]
MSRSTLLLPLAAAGCFAQVWADGSALFGSETDSDATSAAATSSGASEGTGGPVQTVTSETPTTSSTGSLESSTTLPNVPNEPPEIVSFTVEPDTLLEAGSAEALAIVSADVVSLTLRVDGEEVWSGPPSEFAWVFHATSKAASEGTYALELVASDSEGLTASASAMLWVTLPETGTQKCVFEEDVGASWLTATVYADDALIVAGALAKPSLEATLWRLDRDSCQPQAGYPWSISQWTALPEVQPPSQIVGLALDAEGRMALAANLGSGVSRRPYIAVLSPEGALEWERLGPMGQTYSAIAAGPERFFVVGELLVGEAPPRYDGLVESYDAMGTKAWSDVLAAPLPGDSFPDDMNIYDEHPHAVLWSEDVNALVIAGERFVLADKNKRQRAIFTRYSANGAILGAWTSDGSDADEDALLSITACGDELVASGWVRNEQSTRSPATRWLDPSSDAVAKRRLDLLNSTIIQGIACDREQKFAAAASSEFTAFALGFRAGDDPFLFKLDFPDSTLKAADCDDRGFCVVGGLHGDRAWARVHHP